MNPEDVTVPSAFKATCTECKRTTKFETSDGDSESLVVEYACTRCGHTIRLFLDPFNE